MRLDALKQEQEFAKKVRKNKKETLDFRHQCQMKMLYVSKSLVNQGLFLQKILLVSILKYIKSKSNSKNYIFSSKLIFYLIKDVSNFSYSSCFIVYLPK